MTAPQKWVRKGEPGHVEVMGDTCAYLRVNVYANDGGLLYSDRMPMDKRTGGPKGYVLEGSATPPMPRKKHEWGTPVRMEGLLWGQRCPHCLWERMEQSAGGYYAFRRPGGAWEAMRRVPKCEVVP